MSKIEIQNWILECDIEATRQAYMQIPLGDPETCGCLYCRNFIAVRHLAYPKAALSLYEQLGITANREAEVYECGPSEDSLHLYGGWHHFIGRIIYGPGTAPEIAEHFSISFSGSRACAEQVFDDHPLVQVEFFTRIPWILAEKPISV
jgi:hypothetical protein